MEQPRQFSSDPLSYVALYFFWLAVNLVALPPIIFLRALPSPEF